MKKFISGLMIFSMLSLAAPKPEAHAGFTILATLEQHLWDHKHNIDGFIMVSVGTSMLVWGFFVLASGLYSPYSITSGIILLDEKLDAKQGDIKTVLAAAYPFLDEDQGLNGPALENLSAKIIERAADTPRINGVQDVKLSEIEILNATKSLDLSSEQKDALIQSLSK